MKKRGMLLLLGCMFLGALGVLAAPWGAMADYVDEYTPSKTGEKYLLRKILNGQTLSIGLQRDAYTDKHYDKLSRLIVDSYNDWFFNAARHIEQSGREAEFADILPILRQGVRVQMSEQGSDVNFVFMPFKEVQWQCGRGAGGCYTLNEPIPHIYLPADTGLLKVLSLGRESKKRLGTHEIGHSLGFSDQYFQARSINSDVIYGSTEERDTIMQHAGHLTCDDADGMINLIDITRGTRRGGDHGWKTLCPKSQEYYIGGMSAGKGPYRITLSKDKGAVVLMTYEKGQKVASEVYPFATPQGPVQWQETPTRTTSKKDRFGRPVVAHGPNGETIYYAYLYDRVERVSVQNGLALNFVTQVNYLPKQRSGSLKDYKEMFFGQQGVVCLLKTRTFTKRGYASEYVESVNKPQISRYIKRGYDQRGQLVENVYEEPNAPQQKRQRTSLRSVAVQRGTVAVEQGINQQINRQMEANRQSELVNKLDQWTQRTLQGFSRQGK
ncbi:MAG: hypothetical protein J6Y17_00945 [Elusimicrobiaceae bacterium]|nr:hypothetical protein [Elusimicrobiaceae bacterium]